MKNKTIEKRIIQLKRHKDALLHLPKKQRGNEVNIINETIARLKQWDKELELKRSQKLIQNSIESLKKQFKRFEITTIRTGKEVSEGMKRFKQACEMKTPTFCESINYKQVNHFGN